MIIPCYRCKDSIGRAVNSILQQTLLPCEVILVDDASHDGTLEVLHELAKQYPGWLKVIELNLNSGAAGARNKGWAAAAHPYIAFLDADDSWHPEKIRIQYGHMLANESIAMSGHLCDIYKYRNVYLSCPVVLNTRKIKPISLIFKNCFWTPTVMLKRDIPFRFTKSKRFAEDFYLWQQIAFSGLLVTRIELPLAYVYKKLYGEAGLSAQLWEMEKGELNNFVRLYKTGILSVVLFFIAYSFSFLKFSKRFIVNFFRSWY